MGKKFYITTPIYYVNDTPHIGHAYTNIAADTLARYKRLAGEQVFLLTGTDEHGQKIERAARQQNLTPKELADKMVAKFKDLWKELHISYDGFIRTTDAHHIAAVQHVFTKIYESGDIYRGIYEGWYCTPCESYWKENQLYDDKCPSCGGKVEWLKERSFFFKISNYKERLHSYIKENPNFIQPSFRKTEVINFIKEELRDLCITRTSFQWGVPVPLSECSDVVYVWFDALVNYLSGVGYMGEGGRFEEIWPPNVHIIGKDILRFHAIIWPTMLFSAGIEPPKKVFAHGWWTRDGKKMSKSLGNVVDPYRVIKKIGADAFRYFLLREVPFGLDGDFTEEALLHRINGDLANDFGNLVSRTLAMIQRFSGGRIPERGEYGVTPRDVALSIPGKVEKLMENLQFSDALEEVWNLIHFCNRYIDKEAPWNLAKKGESKKLNSILYNLAESLRFIAILLFPFIPVSAKELWRELGIQKSISEFGLQSLKTFGLIGEGTMICKGEPLFPRIEKVEINGD